MGTLHALSMMLLALPGSPESTLKSFAEAVTKGDFAGVSALVVGGSSDLSGFKLLGPDFNREPGTLTIKVESIQKSGLKATAKIASTIKKGTFTDTLRETVELLEQPNKAWKIVAPKKPDPRGIVQILSYLAADPKGAKKMMEQSQANAVVSTRLSNMKQLTTAMLIVLVDSDEKFPKASTDIQQLIKKEVKAAGTFNDPLSGKPLKLSLNPALFGKISLDVSKPNETVMLFWGTPGNLWFDEKGFTYIGFVDGSAKRFTKTEAAKLRWKM